MTRSWWLAAGVFAAALALLGFGVDGAGIASGWVDPVGRIAAQDEAVYSHTALEMAARGDWLTPRFLGRLALYKAPALYWFSGLSAKLFGPSRAALRLPSLLAGALIATLVFVWARRLAGTAAGLAATLLFLLNPLTHILARFNLTDMLLAVWIVGAMAVLDRGRSPVLFGVLSGMAVMTKGVAGLLPLVILAVWCARERRGRFVLAAAVAIAAILPWHLYQLAAHPRWFWAEYIQDEIFFWGAGTPPQTSAENQAWFYLRRLVWMDPLLCALALAGAACAIRRRAAEARLPALWIGTIAAAVLAFSYRNVAYLLPAIPALSILAGAYLPLWRGRAGLMALAALAALVPVKASYGNRVWGLPFYRGTVPSGKTLASYCEMGRSNELIVVSPDDEFLSAALPLERVRYVFLMPQGYHDARALDFRHLGIVVTVDEFLRLHELAPVFSARLREWNQESDRPIGTAIIARSEEEIRRLIERSPERDFLTAAPARQLLLSRTGARTSRPRAGCGL